ncbi:L-rhamnose mutarotase [Adhaeribacter pallidiroseus]|uniref:L-rhamnose mutarotase n=1 Tax=Adhaeribacter pallidiroseus TaxID=2072847 RepID=A0A369QQW7_9BACT|nr:L-rhamnose mutarotase [Adhaeribacter pallidiroseus]RDC65229.1 L-rhamnose mutarotase [Adhaeribacter pallidiroseus]
MKRYCLALDLHDNPELVAQYEHWHKPENFRPEIKQSILEAGITNMEIYRFGTRLFMIMDTDDNFSFERKAAMDAANPQVQDWENFVWQFQKPVPGAKAGEKWTLMDNIFKL